MKKPAPDAIVVALAASTVNIRAHWWIQPPLRAEVLNLQDKVLISIKNKLTANGIDLPFPTQQILFHDQTEETDGDRSQQREGWPVGKLDGVWRDGSSILDDNARTVRLDKNGRIGFIKVDQKVQCR